MTQYRYTFPFMPNVTEALSPENLDRVIAEQMHLQWMKRREKDRKDNLRSMKRHYRWVRRVLLKRFPDDKALAEYARELRFKIMMECV